MEWIQYLIDWFYSLYDLFVHLDVHLNELVKIFGAWFYLILFLVIFCETGLVITPILPGDSLLFAVGALAALDGSPLNVNVLAILLIIAAVLGDLANFMIGAYVGPKVFKRDGGRFLNKKHLERTQSFYQKYGGKTIVLARFIPIIRTFAPFVAGIGKMQYRKFAVFNVFGGVVWILLFLWGGYFLGNVPTVKHNFHIVIVGIIVISVMPAVIEYWQARRAAQQAQKAA